MIITFFIIPDIRASLLFTESRVFTAFWVFRLKFIFFQKKKKEEKKCELRNCSLLLLFFSPSPVYYLCRRANINV